MISRTMFCEYCFKRNRPQVGDMYVTYGVHGGGFIIDKARFGKEHAEYKKKMLGFTPHIITKKKTVDGYVYYEAACGMNGCDTVIKRGKDEELLFSVMSSRHSKMTTADWNAMILNPDIGYRI